MLDFFTSKQRKEHVHTQITLFGSNEERIEPVLRLDPGICEVIVLDHLPHHVKVPILRRHIEAGLARLVLLLKHLLELSLLGAHDHLDDRVKVPFSRSRMQGRVIPLASQLLRHLLSVLGRWCLALPCRRYHLHLYSVPPTPRKELQTKTYLIILFQSIQFASYPPPLDDL